MSESNWEIIQPQVKASSEFLEIASDFGNPFEVFREALHNAYDWHATEFNIKIHIEDYTGSPNLIIEMTDNGVGMDKETLMGSFWNLGDSRSKNNKDSIGEKGHGTKIYLRSNKVIVHTSDGNKSYESVCEGAFASLSAGNVHCPKIREVEEQYPIGTSIRIEGYNGNQTELYRQNIIKDYLYWFTILGTVATEFENKPLKDFKVTLQAVGVDIPEELKMGHRFAKENSNIEQLFKEHGAKASDYYVRRFIYPDQETKSRADIRYDVVIYYEGNEAKNSYNDMLRKRKNPQTGSYKVADRYGLWLCKDFVPIQRVNEWITNFGNGSNSFGLLHGFINCQHLSLTANRGTIANTNLRILEDIREGIDKIIDEINTALIKDDIDTLRQWNIEAQTKETEETHFYKRKGLIEQKQYFIYQSRRFMVPRNEAELYGLFMSLYALNPENFDFEPLDYDERIGVDLIARNKSDNRIVESEFWYVELKYMLGSADFNHSFSYLRRILCWDLDKSVKDGSVLKSSVEDSSREVKITPKTNTTSRTIKLVSDASDIAIRVYCLKDYIEDVLQIKFEKP